VLFRHGLGTKDEYYINLQVHVRDGFCSANGSFAIVFARGVPISTVFAGNGYNAREELLISRVLPARGRGSPAERFACFYHRQEEKITDFASLVRQDYAAVDIAILNPAPAYEPDPVELPEWPSVLAAGKHPVAWHRQVLFLKDDDPAGANYLLLRDTVSGGQPTMWQFWTLSEKVGTPEEIANREAFLADKPGNKPVAPRELKGDRFIAIGQLGVDVEYYIASPTGTPRYTLRCGEDGGRFCKHANIEYQDLLHLQMPGDGAYFVALFPHQRGEPAPSFRTLGNGTIIQVAGEFGTDYCFLSEQEGETSGDGAFFRGTAASVQDRKSGLVLCLGAKGEVRYKAYGLSGDQAASLHVGERSLTIELPAGHTGTVLTITAPGSWVLEKSAPGTRLQNDAERCHVLTVPKEVCTIVLVRP